MKKRYKHQWLYLVSTILYFVIAGVQLWGGIYEEAPTPVKFVFFLLGWVRGKRDILLFQRQKNAIINFGPTIF